MYFYVFKNEEGEIIGFLQSDTTINYPNSHMVTKEEFITNGGCVNETEAPSSIGLGVSIDQFTELEETLDILMEELV